MTEPHVAGHATHFLRRLDRVEGEHVELAMLLYKVPEIVHEVLQHTSVPDDADRVALSLEDAEDGPFIVVTHDGHFVTCLGKGMKPHGLPVVTRKRLDLAMGRVGRMHERVLAARALAAEGTTEVARLVKETTPDGPLTSREDFLALARFEPLMETGLTRAALTTETIIEDGFRTMSAIPSRRWKPQHDYLLEKWWDALWSWANLFVLMNVGDARRRADDIQAATDDWSVDVRMITTVDAMWYGIVSPTARALWAVGRQARLLLPSLELAPLESSPLTRALRDLPLAIIAHASPKGRLEALRLLTLRPESPDAAFERSWDAVFAAPIASALIVPRATALASFDEVARASAFRVLRDRENLPAPIGSPEDVPLDVARALFVSGDQSWVRDLRVLAHSIVPALPWLAQAEASELFLPREWARALAEPYRRDRARRLLDSLAGVLGGGRGAPARAKPTIGRNDPCPCRSGLKYKRCCGATGKKA